MGSGRGPGPLRGRLWAPDGSEDDFGGILAPVLEVVLVPNRSFWRSFFRSFLDHVFDGFWSHFGPHFDDFWAP